MKIVLTGGHLAPALAVIDALPKESEILFIGRKYTFEGDKAESLEYREITARKIPFASLTTGRLQRKLTQHTLPSLVKFPYGLMQTYQWLTDFQPDVILTFGGYLSLPVILSGAKLHIPIIIHEQTLEAGLANKIGAKFANKICISWETSKRFFSSEKTILTGNPLRIFSSAIFPFSFSKADTHLPLIYITGGSGGSHWINELVEGSAHTLLKRFRILHQTGDSAHFGDYEGMQTLRETLPPDEKRRLVVTKFVKPENVGSVYKEASIVVSRAGINTISELLYFQNPCLLIPLPHGQNNEQLKNARFLQKLGLAEVAEQKNLTPQKFFDRIEGLIAHRKEYFLKTETPLPQNAASRIIEVLHDVYQKQKTQAK